MKRAALSAAKRFLRCLILRGPLLRWWIRRQDRRLDRAYLRNLLRLLPTAHGVPAAPPIAHKSASLRRVLFIADCMWEVEQLVPELEKTAPVTVLNLHRALRDHRAQPPPAVVISTLRRFISDHRTLAPDVILFYARSSLLSDEAFALLRGQWSCPLLGMNLDDKTEFFPYHIFSAGNDDYLHWARQFDLNLTSSITAAGWYRRSDLPCHYLAMGFHPTPETSSPPNSARFEHLLTFVGSWKPERQRMIQQLANAGIAVTPFGHGWRGSQWLDNSCKVYRQSQLNLGLGFATTTGGIVNLKARDFECPGAGGCYLTTYNWELARHYEIGKEILCYRSLPELIEMYLYYAGRPAECLRIAQAAHRRCAAEHTWEQRFRALFREIGLLV